MVSPAWLPAASKVRLADFGVAKETDDMLALSRVHLDCLRPTSLCFRISGILSESDTIGKNKVF